VKSSLKNKIVKSNKVYNLSRGFDGLSRKAQINLICHHFNIKKNIILNFLKLNHVFFTSHSLIPVILRYVKLIESCQTTLTWLILN